MARTPKPIRRRMKFWGRHGVSWVEIGLVYGSWIECNPCGYRPNSQRDMDTHRHPIKKKSQS